MRAGVYNLRSRRSFREIERALRGSRADDAARILHYSVQGNHIHLIIEADGRVRLARCVQVFEIRVALWLNRMMKRTTGKVFADRYHAHVLRTPREMRFAFAYALRNHQKHFGRRAWIDPYSSAASFDGWAIPVSTRWSPISPGPPLIAEAESWLARVGWRRHGQIDPIIE